MPIQSYRDLRVWQKGMDLAAEVYHLTRNFPKEEMFGMTSQIRRSAASIPANIAEGYRRNSKGEYVQFLRIAQGSLKELETHLMLSARVKLCIESNIAPLLKEAENLGKMLWSLMQKLRT